MGLAQRKDKQRIGYDPRNLTWANDKDRFSLKHMSKLGWEEGAGIGKDQTGRASHIAVMRKLDNTGIGMGRAKKEGEELSAGAGQAGAGLEDVLKRLASRKNTPTTTAEPSPASTPPAESSPGPSALRNKMASRQRHLHSKRLASQSPAALAEILGVPISSLPATPTESPSTSGASTPAAKDSSPEATTEGTGSESEPKRDSLESVSTSKMSVSEYFRMKLREKALARQAASGSSTPVPALAEGSLAVMKEEVKITQDGVGWEGTKMKFEEVETTELLDLGPEYERPGSDQSEESKAEVKEKKSSKSKGKEKASDDEDKAAKKARKEEKRAKKEEKEEKRRRKEEKKAEKEAKKDGKKDKKRKRDEDGDEDGKKRKSKKD